MDLAANAEGSKVVYQAIIPALNENDPKLADQLDSQFNTAVATSGVASTLDLIQHFSQESTQEKENNQIISMFGKHQPGIITEQQTYCYLVAFELLTDDKAELVSLLQDWTLFALKATKGIQVKDSSNDLLPPNDTGDSIGLGAQKLTLTIGYGANVFEKMVWIVLELRIENHYF
jgi:hypothetical protein